MQKKSLAGNKALICLFIWTKLCNSLGIFNGTVTKIEKYPNQVYINYITPNNFTAQLCGGSIINEFHVLTSCHCFGKFADKDKPSEFIVAGDSRWEMSKRSKHRQERSIDYLTFHPGCLKDGFDYVDLAVAKVNERFHFGRFVTAIPLAQSQPPVGTACSTVGWGDMISGKRASKILKAKLNVAPFLRCGSYYADEEKFICAYSSNGYQSPCYGDCGGPLICNDRLVGILEGGYGVCGESIYGNYYTSVAKYTEWIAAATEIHKINILRSADILFRNRARKITASSVYLVVLLKLTLDFG